MHCYIKSITPLGFCPRLGDFYQVWRSVFLVVAFLSCTIQRKAFLLSCSTNTQLKRNIFQGPCTSRDEKERPLAPLYPEVLTRAVKLSSEKKTEQVLNLSISACKSSGPEVKNESYLSICLFNYGIRGHIFLGSIRSAWPSSSIKPLSCVAFFSLALLPGARVSYLAEREQSVELTDCYLCGGSSSRLH